MVSWLSATDTFKSIVSVNSPILDFTVGKYNGELAVWYLVDSDSAFETSEFELYVNALGDGFEATFLDEGNITDLNAINFKETDGLLAYKDDDYSFTVTIPGLKQF